MLISEQISEASVTLTIRGNTIKNGDISLFMYPIVMYNIQRKPCVGISSASVGVCISKRVIVLHSTG